MKKSIQEDAARAFDEMAQKADERADRAADGGDGKLESCCRSVAKAYRENAEHARSKAMV